jgi:hypothetical protein
MEVGCTIKAKAKASQHLTEKQKTVDKMIQKTKK